MFLKTTEEINGSEGGIWTSGECGITEGGLPLFNYYAETESYIFGVLTSLHNYLEERGWYCEWYDAGTIMIYQD